MPVNWMDVADLSFNTLLLLERVQLGWLSGWLDEQELAEIVDFSGTGRNCRAVDAYLWQK